MHFTINTYTDDSQIYIWLSWWLSGKESPAKQETQVQSLGLEDTLEKETATPPSVLAWQIPWTEEQSGLQSMGSQGVGSVQFSSVAQSCPTLCNPMNRSSPGLPVHHQLLEFTQTHVQVGDAMQPSHPLSSPFPPALIPPSIRVFSNESNLHIRWPDFWSFSFSISPSNEHPGLVSFRMDWLALLAVQGTLKSLLQHHSSKFFGAQLSLQSNSRIHT